MKVVRKYIPLPIRVEVATQQALAIALVPSYPGSLKKRLAWLLALLFHGRPCELHHRPALENRPLNRRGTDHVPPANDPNYLVYLLKDEHKIETYVRGVRGQFSDAGLRRRNKRMAKNRESKPITTKAARKVWGGFTGAISPVTTITALRLPKYRPSDSRSKTRRPKRKWPSRPFPKGRKLRWRR